MKASEYVPAVEPRVTLDMSRDEAITLLLIAHWIGGDDFTTRRGHVTKLTMALNALGIYPTSEQRAEVELPTKYAGIYFKERKSNESQQIPVRNADRAGCV